ncbi:RHD3c, RHD3/Sey1 family GTPase involved in the ER-to-Golgi traffic [Ectocarpus siliculosus]|uniref:RHD3c, RHD3/Sey1 family GTPase involved in the ER-to-Golgi traffic n=1 Tax=Ectocarpus siliculosus TaxID=2880 RepID=D8LCC3_ECTSI|nr:RHD3c, RHD3/Sey1 family GTPase involved in the ER-to-Golgi traffic [Ectocarpus siliculosus]|eukprot:CBN78159.1 RHD3c, RHD3/Sey1 family GTPase involved in the ER-to-Golgi traffic [Ectocarpus siliculosus]
MTGCGDAVRQELRPCKKLGASHDYRVVAVTGCQCSGKSTLLNALFGTGIHEKRLPKEGASGGAATATAASAAAVPSAAPTPFVLVDVEGTQSRDRGGTDGMEFDSRTTLFAVMAADVIMLNLWAHDVGRADGQAYSVLRSVFEEAVRLYEGQDGTGDVGSDGPGPGTAGLLAGREGTGAQARFPKVLMLVLRDVEEDEHLEALDKAARANLEALWRDVDKPSSLRDAGLSEVFDVRTCGLPHFIYQRREFAAKAATLSRSFLDPTYRGFIFRKPRRQAGVVGWEGAVRQRAENPGGRHTLHAPVPLSQLRQRLEGIWTSASSNNRLAEAPRRGEQQGAVALSALAESCLSEARPRCARLLTDVEAAVAGEMPLLQFGTDAQEIVDEAVQSFLAKSSRSQIDAPAAVLREKRGSLVSAVARELEPAFRAHARHLRGHFHEQFEEVFSCVLGGAADFDQSSRRMSKTIRQNFLEATKLAIPNTPGVADVWRLHWEAELVKLNEDMESRVQDRLSEGTWMLPSDPAEQAAAARKKTPWWKGLVLRAAAMYFNYLQATQHLRRAKKGLGEKREGRAAPSALLDLAVFLSLVCCLLSVLLRSKSSIPRLNQDETRNTRLCCMA